MWIFSCIYALFCKLIGGNNDVAPLRNVAKNSTFRFRNCLASITLLKASLFFASVIICITCLWFIDNNHFYAFILLNAINFMVCVFVIKWSAGKIRSIRFYGNTCLTFTYHVIQILRISVVGCVYFCNIGHC